MTKPLFDVNKLKNLLYTHLFICSKLAGSVTCKKTITKYLVA